MQTLDEIGPSNASQGKQRKENATEQIKNLTLAMIRTQALGLSRRRSTELSENIYIHIYIRIIR